MEKEKITRWKARPPTVQAPEVDEEEDAGGSLPMGRRRRRRSKDAGNAALSSTNDPGSRGSSANSSANGSANSSRRNSKEEFDAGGAGGDSSVEQHGDLMIQNIEDEAAG